MKEINKLPFETGSPLNFFYKMRLKRGLTQGDIGVKVNRNHTSVCQYENATARIPKAISLEIPVILNFSDYEKNQFKKFLAAAENRIEKKDRETGQKNHMVKAGWKKNGTSKKVPTQKTIKKIKISSALSREDIKNLKWLNSFINEKGGKEAINDLLKIRKALKKILA